MRLSPEMLVADGGEIYCHIFENPLARVSRNLFWSVTIDFKIFRLGNEECKCSATCEWLRWPIRKWFDLDGCRADFRYGEHGFESSFYVFGHHPAERTCLSLRHKSKNDFDTIISMELAFPDNLGIEVNNPFVIRAETTVPFTGLLVIPENLGLKSANENQVEDIAAEFVDPDTFKVREPYNHGLRFRPSYDELDRA